MKLLMTTDTVGGVWHYAVALCRGLLGAGIDVVLATMGTAPTPAQRRTLATLDGIVVEESGYRLEWMRDAVEDDDLAAGGRWLLSLAARHGVDLVHVNGYFHAGLPFGRPTIAVAHSDVLSWFQWVRGQAAPPEWNVYRFNVERGLETAAAIVTPTDAVRQDLVRHFGVRSDRCHVIPNGIPLGDYAPGGKLPFVFAAGRIWDEAKNIAQLTRIADRISWPIRVAGDRRHPEGGEWKSEGVEYLGMLGSTEMAAMFSSASIFAAPARYEPFGLAILEAAASGCALVLSDIPSLRQIWGDAALFVPPDDDHGWIGTFSRLIAFPEKRQRLAEAALVRACRYGVARMVDSYGRLYASLCRQAHYADA